MISRKKRVMILSYLLIGMIPASVVSADDYVSTVSVNDGSLKHFSGDSTINVASGNGLELSKEMGKVSIDDGAVMHITSGSGNGITAIDAAIAAQIGNAVVEFGETHITAKKWVFTFIHL